MTRPVRQPRVYRPLIDVDVGIGRRYGYDDRVRDYRTGFERGTVEAPRNPASCHIERETLALTLCGSCYVIYRNRARKLLREMNARSVHRTLVGSRT